MTLLSGKCCSLLVNFEADVEYVLYVSAHLLSLDADEVLRNSTLLHGTSVVTDLSDLEALTTKFGPPPPPKMNIP